MPHLLRLLGGLRLDRDGQPASGRAAHRRRLAVLALLSVSPGKRLTRERINAYLWPDAAPEAARRSLSESLYALRQELGDLAITSNGDELSLDASLVPSDLDALEAAAEAGDARRVAKAYVAPFLDGWFVEDAAPFEQWSELQRVRIHALVVRSLETDAKRREANGDWRGSVESWNAAANLEPYSSSLTSALASSLIKVGEKAEALRVLAAHRARLREDLEIEPDDAIAAIEKQLRAHAVDRSAPMVVELPRIVPGENPLGEREVNPPPQPTARRTIVNRTALVGVALVLALSMVWLVTRGGNGEAAPVVRPIAILMLEHSRSDSALGFLTEDLTTGIIEQLSVNTFPIVPWAEVRTLERSRGSLDSLIAARHVGMTVEGTLSSNENQLRATVRIVLAETHEQIAAATFSRATSEVFALETDLVQFVADALRKHYRQTVLLRDAISGTRDPTARKLVLTALRRYDDALIIAASNARLDAEAAEELLVSADTLLQRASILARTWSRPLIARGHILRDRARLAPPSRYESMLDSAQILADSAVLLNPRDASALELRGMIRWSMARAQRNGARDTVYLAFANDDLQAALDLEPARANAWLTLSFVQTARGQANAGVISAERARKENAFVSDPSDTYFAEFASAMASARLREADRWCAAGRSAFPGEARFLECALTVLRESPATLESAAAAWTLVKQLDELDNRIGRREGNGYAPILRRMMAAAVSAQANDSARARTELRLARARVRANHSLQLDLAFDEAYVCLVLGDTATAVRLLRTLQRERPMLERVIASAPLFKSIRSLVSDAPQTM